MKKVFFGRDQSLKEQKPETPQPTPLNTEQKSNEPITQQTPSSPSIQDSKNQAKLPESSSKNVAEQMEIENINREEDIAESITKRNQEIEKGEEVKDTNTEKLEQNKTVADTNENSKAEPIASKKVIAAVKTTYGRKNPNTKKQENEVRDPSTKNTSGIKKTTGPLQKPVQSLTANLCGTNQPMAKQVQPTPPKNISGPAKVSVPQKKVQNTVNSTSSNVIQNKAEQSKASTNSSQKTGMPEGARVRFKKTRIPIQKNKVAAPSNKEDQITDEEIEKHVKGSVDKFFATHGHSNDKKTYEKHRLPIDITSANGAEIYNWLLTKRKLNKDFLKKEDNQIIVLAHAATNLWRHFFKPQKTQKIISEKTPSHASKQESSSTESEFSSNSDSSSSSDSDSSSEDETLQEGSSAKGLLEKTIKDKQKIFLAEKYSFTEEEIKLVKEYVTKAAIEFFADKSVAYSVDTYKKYLLPLTIPHFSSSKLKAALVEIFSINPKHIEIKKEKNPENKDIQQLYVKEYGVTILGRETLPIEKLPPFLQNARRKKAENEAKQQVQISAKSDNNTKDSKQPEILIPPLDDDRMDVETNKFLIEPSESNIGVVPGSESSLPASTGVTPEVQMTEQTEQKTSTYQLTFFTPSHEKRPHDEKEISSVEVKPIPQASPAKKQRLLAEKEILDNFDKNATTYQQQQKQLETQEKQQRDKAIKHVTPYVNRIKEICNILENKADILKSSPKNLDWQKDIVDSRKHLPQEKLDELSLPKLITLYKSVSSIKKQLEENLLAANQYIKELNAETKRKEEALNFEFSESESENETTTFHG